MIPIQPLLAIVAAVFTVAYLGPIILGLVSAFAGNDYSMRQVSLYSIALGIAAGALVMWPSVVLAPLQAIRTSLGDLTQAFLGEPLGIIRSGATATWEAIR